MATGLADAGSAAQAPAAPSWWGRFATAVWSEWWCCLDLRSGRSGVEHDVARGNACCPPPASPEAGRPSCGERAAACEAEGALERSCHSPAAAGSTDCSGDGDIWLDDWCASVTSEDAEGEKEEEDDDEGPTCCICLEPLEGPSEYVVEGAVGADEADKILRLSCCGKALHTACARPMQGSSCPLCRQEHVPALCRLRLPEHLAAVGRTVEEAEQAAVAVTLPEALREIAPLLRHLIVEAREAQCAGFIKELDALEAACESQDAEAHAELLARSRAARGRLEDNFQSLGRRSGEVLLPKPYVRSTLPGGRRSGFADGLRGAFAKRPGGPRGPASGA